MKSKKKIVLAGLALLAITGLLALSGCKNDSVPPEAHTHTFDWKVETESTDMEVGKLVKKCTTCSEPGGDEMEIPAGFVYIPAGTFQMGSTAGDNNEKPVHGVTISKGYFMGRHVVTQQLYKAVMGQWGGTEPSSTYGVGDDYPAYYVSWYDAVVFCNELTTKELGEEACVYYYNDGDVKKVYTKDAEAAGKTPHMDTSKSGYRLPTEAEWEYAARAGDATTDKITWSGTDTETKLEEYAWYSKNSGSKTHQVGKKEPNAWGLYDMSGNVWEWCWDRYGNYSDESVSDPHGGSSNDRRVNRGGSWRNGSGPFTGAGYCTVSRRNYDDPSTRSASSGFRVVRSAN